jgi:cell division cycle 2-like protein
LLHVINSFIFFAEKLKSKFDDQSESESETKSVHMSDQEDDGYYLADTPPESPVELLPELPLYYPAIQGCRNVEEFHCLNRIEEGAYGVVYRAKDKKTGTGTLIDLKTNILILFAGRFKFILNLES